MEHTDVVIVGAGPAGLTLGLALARYQVHSVVLEKEGEVAEDPRGVVVIGDAVRALYQLGLEEQLKDVSHPVTSINFHQNNFQDPPFIEFRVDRDWPEQSIPGGIFHYQPWLGVMNCVPITTTCEVVGRVDGLEDVVVDYIDGDGAAKHIRCSWLVGADGKRGVVRKKFLEPEAGIKHQTGLYEYTGVWVAANFEITPPTPTTHPDFPLWSAGYSPEDVFDIFWPAGWHFCSHPTRSTATGRFGPKTKRFWRHEFSIEDWNDSMDVMRELELHIKPFLRRDSSNLPGYTGDLVVEFPWDCVRVMRCRPFRFVQKVATQWFDKHTIIIGDAAHVFPPFGGQGIASGIRDAMALSWRLALFNRSPSISVEKRNAALFAWNRERRAAIDDATRMTMTNGRICNRKNPVAIFAQKWIGRLLWSIPSVGDMITSTLFSDEIGYSGMADGCFVKVARGGGKLSQIWLKSKTGPPFLSDEMLIRPEGLLTLYIISETAEQAEEDRQGVDQVFARTRPATALISSKSVVHLATGLAVHNDEVVSVEVLYPCTVKDLLSAGITPWPGYNERSMFRRFGSNARFVIARPDLVVFSISTSLAELASALIDAGELLT